MPDSARLKKLARAYMAAHPGIAYQQALAAVASPQDRDTNRWLDLVDATTAAQLTTRWGASMMTPNLRAPVGIRTSAEFSSGEESEVVWIDLSEQRDGGDGPHAGVFGRAGAGKTELVRTWLKGLAALHSPDRLQFLLADSLWGSYSDLESLPHTVGSVMGLASDDRRALALAKVVDTEIDLRVERIEAQGPYVDGRNDIQGYRRLTVAGQAPPMPELVVVVDDVDDLASLSANRALLGALGRVARLGRAVGVHLVLGTSGTASLPPALMTHLSPNICLAVDRMNVGRLVVGTTAVASEEIPPGCGYFRRTLNDDPYPFRAFTTEGQRSNALCELMAATPSSATGQVLPEQEEFSPNSRS